MKVLFLRHGATAGNELRRYIGRTDEPLSPQGIRETGNAGGSAALFLVYVTPLLRTRQTAEIMFPNAQQIIVEDLREMDFGDFEGRNAQEMEFDQAYRDWVNGGCLGQCPGGESREAFTCRVQAAFEKTMITHMYSEMNFGTDTAVFVVHGGTIMAVLEKYARPAMTFYEGHVGNCQGFLCTLSSSAGEEELPFLLTDITKVEKVNSGTAYFSFF